MTCQRRSAYDVIELGYSPSQAKAWKRTAESFLGPADSPKVQRETVAAAEQAGLSIDRLTMINRHALRLKSRGQAWALRAELVAMTDSYKEVNAHAAARVEEILGPRPPEAGVCFGRAKTACARCRLLIHSVASRTWKRPSTPVSKNTSKLAVLQILEQRQRR